MQALEFSVDLKEPLVFVDDREEFNEVTSRLEQLGARLKIQRLDVADFVASPRAGIERKAYSDLESSIIDGRLFQQALELKRNFERPLVGVVGSGACRINGKALRGALISISIDYGIPVLFFEDDVSLGDFIFHVAFREQLAPAREQRLRLEKKKSVLSEQQRFVVESLPGVGPSAAKKLLARFGSVAEVFDAHEDELCQVDGIGVEKAREIRKVTAAEYFEPGS
ncbi:TPA: hypothetical protein HA318_00685 [Candidatus Micrarchaeota archaeon]|nr:MAG: hypothetical protein AUJ65_00695 [Candidatus Micrarchaeota archaeon CG1_02_51_15]HII38504.1 hypothetical protein [Candidatus Micrarchaeota archaeon]